MKIRVARAKRTESGVEVVGIRAGRNARRCRVLAKLAKAMAEPLGENFDLLVFCVDAPFGLACFCPNQQALASPFVGASIPDGVEAFDAVQRNEVAPDRESENEKAAFQSRLIEGDALAAQQHDWDDPENKQRDKTRAESRRDRFAARIDDRVLDEHPDENQKQ